MYAWEWSCTFGTTKAGFTVEWAATCTWKEKSSYPNSNRSYPNDRNCSRNGSKSHLEGEKVSIFFYSSQGDSNESFGVREKVKNCTNFVFFFFFFLMFWLKWECWNDEIESAWWVVMYKLVLNCIVIELCKMIDVVSLKPLNNISFFKIMCYLC